jgi:nucleoside-diphosphate-sugar epimerase
MPTSTWGKGRLTSKMPEGRDEMNLLVGGTGFIGGHVVEYLFRQNEISKGTFRKGSHLKVMDLNGVQGLEADLMDHHSLHEAFEGVENLYSMASPMPYGDSDFERVNTEGVLNLLEAAQEVNAKSVVHLSTLDVYGFGAGNVSEESRPEPSGEYQRSKAEADRILLEFGKRNTGTRVVVIRAARALGSRDYSMSAPIVKMAQAGRVVVPSSRKMSFTHADDIAQAMFRATANTSLSNRVFLIKSFDATPLELAAALAAKVAPGASVSAAGMFSKGSLPQYTGEQLRAGLTISEQPSWKDLGYAPDFDLQRSAEEVAQWQRKDPWAVQGG